MGNQTAGLENITPGAGRRSIAAAGANGVWWAGRAQRTRIANVPSLAADRRPSVERERSAAWQRSSGQ
jgi:hypothetical protein